MGSITSSFQTEELAVFKDLPPNYNGPIHIPERAQNRATTDRNYLIAFGVMVIALLPFLIYTLVYSDINRTFVVYDQCGNICGQNNAKYDQWQCTGQDVTNKRLLEVSDVNGTKVDIYLAPRLCVSECSRGYDEVSGYCLKRNYNENGTFDYYYNDDDFGRSSNVANYLESMSWRIVLACFLSLAIGIIMLLLFRTATAVMVWLIIVTVLLILTFGVAILWYLYTIADQYSSRGFLVLAIFFTVFLLVLVLVVVLFRKRIALVIALMKETMKATFAMPRLLIVPILVLFAEIIILGAFAVTTVYMSTAGILSKQTSMYLIYKKNFAMIFAIFFNSCMTVWSLQFIAGIHYMIIAGAVSRWYFASDKRNLENPVMTATSVAFKFHLGSVALGSMLITIVVIIRSLLASITRNGSARCCSLVERLVKFLSKNAYLLTAMHGQTFFKSGKRAVQIIIQNVVNVAAVNYIGSFIIFMAQLLVVLLSLVVTALVLLGTESTNQLYVYMIVLVVSLIVAIISFSVFETAMATIFLCFCEDCILNDGMTRPFAMSAALTEFMENSKKVFPKTKEAMK